MVKTPKSRSAFASCNTKILKLKFCRRYRNEPYYSLFAITIGSDSTQTRALQWVPMNFFPKIPEIDLRRFSLQFSLGVVVAIHEKLEKFQNISIEDLSENLQ
jgi:hypothetical protein